MDIIDSHHHLWDYDPQAYPWINESMSVLKDDFSIQDLSNSAAQSSPTLNGSESKRLAGTVAVQAQQTVSEAEWLVECSKHSSLIKGVVGWLPLAATETELLPLLERFAAEECFKGVRHVVQDEPDEKFLLRNDFSRGVGQLRSFNLVYDILIYARQLPMAAALVDRHPEQVFVLDHIAKPTIDSTRFDTQWAENIRQLAKRENVACKFSGVVTEVRDSNWTVETLRPYWETVLEVFGAERLMFGSDWPVCLLRARYDQWVSTVQAFAEELSLSERQQFWHDNAVRYYNLSVI